MHYLAEAKESFEKWQLSGGIGLLPKRFLRVLKPLEQFLNLQMKHEFEYLLPGKLLFDLIEGRFGWYRQWGNFYISVKQLLLAGIHGLSLLQQHALLAATNLGDHESAALDSSFASSSATNHLWLVEFLSLVVVHDDLRDAEFAVAYSASGCIVRSTFYAAENMYFARLCSLMLLMIQA